MVSFYRQSERPVRFETTSTTCRPIDRSSFLLFEFGPQDRPQCYISPPFTDILHDHSKKSKSRSCLRNVVKALELAPTEANRRGVKGWLEPVFQGGDARGICEDRPCAESKS